MSAIIAHEIFQSEEFLAVMGHPYSGPLLTALKLKLQKMDAKSCKLIKEQLHLPEMKVVFDFNIDALNVFEADVNSRLREITKAEELVRV